MSNFILKPKLNFAREILMIFGKLFIQFKKKNFLLQFLSGISENNNTNNIFMSQK
jgi:hypothetical protein